MRGNSGDDASVAPREAPVVEAGDYFAADRRLYCVEQVAFGRALVEDCLTGSLIDVPVEDLNGFRRVRAADSDDGGRGRDGQTGVASSATATK